MTTPEKILEQMDAILDRLIQIAETMQRLSKQVVSEGELAPLQKSQEDLVSQLESLDDAFEKAYKPGPGAQPLAVRSRIAKKIERFQVINADFIENLKTEQKLIEIEAPSPKSKHKAIPKKTAPKSVSKKS
ncbi:MAG: hypothetical protein LLG04_17440 [Parachlamydia sp.]|nr:hypothetical protein [Parachlamydia sp.]